MFVYSMKATTVKFFGVVCVALVTLIVLIAFVDPYEPVNAGEVNGSGEAVDVKYGKINGSEDVRSFLLQFGWETDNDPIETVNVTVPHKFDRVLSEYNQIQRAQGLNLEKYKGKDVIRYTFRIKNYNDSEGEVYANVLVDKKKVIGGDVCSADASGFVHGFDFTE